ncbi:MAG TPA: two-component regulator propeller domain-containing protein, partial [Pyrinomonadaceae bacterium]|nr:two-component regulator propeller domain-containing protein [Pyrinomonadaceae bacterium]
MKIANSVFAAFVLLFLTHSAHALDPSQPFSSYIRTRFTADDGLPHHVVNQIVQSQDGFLWILLGSGQIVRFDGRRFTELPIGPADEMAIGPDNDLWVVTATDLIQIPAAAFNQFGPLQAIKYPISLGTNIRAVTLHFSRSGILWVGTNAGLYRFERGVFSLVAPHLDLQTIEESSTGNLLLPTAQGFMEWDGSQLVAHSELPGQLGVKVEEIHYVFEDSRGITWFCTAKGVARRIGQSIEKLQPWGRKTDGAIRAYEDRQGNVWIAGSQGLVRATASGLELAAAGMNVRYMYGDRDGNLWVGTNGDGLFRFKDRAVRMFTIADGLPSNVPMTVLTSHDGSLWSGFNCGGLARFDGSGFRIYTEKDGLLNDCVWSLAEDANHDLWIGTFGGGIFRFRNGSFTQYSKAQGLASEKVVAIVPARDGSLWCATNRGVSRLHNGQVRNYKMADGLSSDKVLRIYEDRGGGIWVGGMKGVDRLEGDRFLKISSVPNVPADVLGEDHSGAIYVSLYNSHIFRIDRDRFIEVIPNSQAAHMIETEQGDFWFNGGSILRVPGGALDKPRGHDEPLDFAVFGLVDGLLSPEGSIGYPSLALTRDGKLWMATVQGLAMLDLPRLPRTDRKSAIYMKEFTVGRNQQLPGQQLVLPAGTSHVELNFDAIEITSPEKIRMQYRLDGVDSEWLDVAPPGHAVYSTIPPGTHAFHIRACNRDGIWDRAGMVYLITQQPFFYQTIWFRLAMIATGLLLVFGLYRLRLRQATVRLNARFDERLAERTRIARELHDTLLQTVQGSKLVADDALEKSDDSVPLPVRQSLERLSKWLGQATQEGRAALNSLRTSTVDTNDLAEGLRRATEECVIDRSIAVRFSATGGPRDLHPIAREEIYRIGYEAIRNACEHSSASELNVSLNYAQNLTLRVNDNGIGIETVILAEGKEG